MSIIFKKYLSRKQVDTLKILFNGLKIVAEKIFDCLKRFRLDLEDIKSIKVMFSVMSRQIKNLK